MMNFSSEEVLDIKNFGSGGGSFGGGAGCSPKRDGLPGGSAVTRCLSRLVKFYKLGELFTKLKITRSRGAFA